MTEQIMRNDIPGFTQRRLGDLHIGIFICKHRCTAHGPKAQANYKGISQHILNDNTPAKLRALSEKEASRQHQPVVRFPDSLFTSCTRLADAQFEGLLCLRPK